MKKLSRDEMKQVLGGMPPLSKWRCQIDDYSTPGGVTWELCNAANPETACVDTWDCTYLGTCTSGPACINY